MLSPAVDARTAATGAPSRSLEISFNSVLPQLVAAEIQELKEVYGVQHIWFGDDIFALNQRWMQQFADEIEARACSLPFKIQSRADLMSRGNGREPKTRRLRGSVDGG